jgi:hypothetical protein
MPANDDPEALAEGLVRLDPVDHRDAERGEEPGEREHVRVGVGQGDAHDEVGRDEERDKERRVGEGRGRDHLLAGDVDACEARGREEAHDEEVEELPRAEAQGTPSSS